MSNQQPTSTFLSIAAVVVLSIAFAVMGGAGVSVQVTETLLDSDAAADFDAAISGDSIVWTTNRGGTLDLFMVTPSGVQPLVVAPGDQEMADIDGVRVVYVDFSIGNFNIFYIADLTTPVSQAIVGDVAQGSLDSN